MLVLLLVGCFLLAGRVAPCSLCIHIVGVASCVVLQLFAFHHLVESLVCYFDMLCY